MVLSESLNKLLTLLEAREHMLSMALEKHQEDDWPEVESILILLNENQEYDELIEEVRSFAKVGAVK